MSERESLGLNYGGAGSNFEAQHCWPSLTFWDPVCTLGLGLWWTFSFGPSYFAFGHLEIRWAMAHGRLHALANT